MVAYTYTFVAPALRRERQKHQKVTVTQRVGGQLELHEMLSKKRAREMAQWIKAFSIKPGDLSSIPRTHMVEGESWYTLNK